MSWFTALFAPASAEQRDTYNSPWFRQWLTGGSVTSGVEVTEATALKYAAFYSAVDLISRGIAQLPLLVYDRLSEGGKKRNAAHPVYDLLHTRPNPEQSAFSWFQVMQGFVLTWGNAYAEIDFAGRGSPTALWPIPPNRVKVGRNDAGLLEYELLNDKGQPDGVLPPERMLHIHTMGDGLTGYSPVTLFRETIGLGLAAEKQSAAFYGNNATPASVLEHPGQLSPDAAAKFREAIEGMHQGPGNRFRFMLLEEGMKWTQIGVSPDDAKTIETQTFTILDVARIFHIPAHKLNEMSRATFSNIEQQAIEWVQDCLGPWMVNWEQELNFKLFTKKERKTTFAEFLVDGLLRGDSAQRSVVYATAITNGWMTRNEVRALENLNPLDGLDEPLLPLNMGAAEDVLNPEEPASEPTEEPDEPADEDDSARAAAIEAHRPSILRQCSFVVTKELNAMRKAAKRPADFLKAAEQFYHNHTDHIRDVLEPAAIAYAAATGTKSVARAVVTRLAAMHVREGLEQLHDAFRHDLEGTLNAWRDTRAALLAERILEGLA